MGPTFKENRKCDSNVIGIVLSESKTHDPDVDGESISNVRVGIKDPNPKNVGSGKTVSLNHVKNVTRRPGWTKRKATHNEESLGHQTRIQAGELGVSNGEVLRITHLLIGTRLSRTQLTRLAQRKD